MVLTPSGKISRYFYGISYPTRPNSARRSPTPGPERIGRPVPTYARVLLLCYDYDPKTGSYTLNVLNAVRTRRRGHRDPSSLGVWLRARPAGAARSGGSAALHGLVGPREGKKDA